MSLRFYLLLCAALLGALSSTNPAASRPWDNRYLKVIDALDANVRDLYPPELFDSVAWDSAYQKARLESVSDEITWRDMLMLTNGLLATLGDSDARVIDCPIYGWADDADLPDSALLPMIEAGPQVSYLRLSKTIGYLCIESWQGDVAAQVDIALDELRDAEGIILDLRAWQAGTVEEGYRVLGRFTDQPLPGAHLRYRQKASFDTTDRCFTVEPRGEWQFMKPVMLLADGAWPAAALAAEASWLPHVTLSGKSRQNVRGVEPVAIWISNEYCVQIPTAALLTENGAAASRSDELQLFSYTPMCGLRDDPQLWDAAEMLEREISAESRRGRDRMDWMFGN